MNTVIFLKKIFSLFQTTTNTPKSEWNRMAISLPAVGPEPALSLAWLLQNVQWGRRPQTKSRLPCYSTTKRAFKLLPHLTVRSSVRVSELVKSNLYLRFTLVKSQMAGKYRKLTPCSAVSTPIYSRCLEGGGGQKTLCTSYFQCFWSLEFKANYSQFVLPLYKSCFVATKFSNELQKLQLQDLQVYFFSPFNTQLQTDVDPLERDPTTSVLRANENPILCSQKQTFLLNILNSAV